jgi:hypothetical protein
MFIIRKGLSVHYDCKMLPRVIPSRSERYRSKGELLKLEVLKSTSRTNGLSLFPLTLLSTPSFNPSFLQPNFQQPQLLANRSNSHREDVHLRHTKPLQLSISPFSGMRMRNFHSQPIVPQKSNPIDVVKELFAKQNFVPEQERQARF